MKQTEKTFQVLDALHREEISTQRQLSEISGISLGQVNYILKSLLEKGFVKLGNFQNNPNKIGYVYLLTPKGLEEKSKLAVKFVLRKLREYEFLKDRVAARLIEIAKEGQNRVIFFGPLMVRDFITSIIKDRDLSLTLVGYYDNLGEVGVLSDDSFDVVLFFDETHDIGKKTENSLDIPREKLLYLW